MRPALPVLLLAATACTGFTAGAETLTLTPTPTVNPPAVSSASGSAPDPAPAPAPKHTNRLALEKSPYLLQHAHNPVDWYPWGDEAFAKAKAEGKPILLSIGYSTCHWCHVMERESFENEEVGKFLKEHFVAIKLDREERPDVDQIYMTAMQALGLGGGWPLNVFLTPDRQPFYGGTYFPPDGRGGRPGFLSVLRRISELWTENPARIRDNARELSEQLQAHMAKESAGDSSAAPLTWELVVRAALGFSTNFDGEYGGFSGAPKFPQPKIPSLILQAAVRTGNEDLKNEVLFTCSRMAAGGIRDQLGGGFARYSVDARWLVPHFEKMLYDNAGLLDLYLDAGLISGDSEYPAVARDIVRYLLRDMTHPEGGFYSAEDADSEGQEGKFYCFTKAEMESLLTAEEAALAVTWFGVTKEGNFVDHSHPHPLPNLNVLSIADPNRRLTEAEAKLLESAKAKLFAAREKRVRPHLDDKILTSWNGLMVGALARAGVVLGEEAWVEAARKNFRFVVKELWDPATKTLYHRWRDGGRDSAQLLNAYAFYLKGAIDLYQATLDPEVLSFCTALAEGMVSRFYDEKAGGFHTSAGDGSLLFRVKDDHDGAEPGGNSTAVFALLQLAAITDNKDWRAKAETTLKFFSQRLHNMPEALPWMLHAVAFADGEPLRAVVAGDPAAAETKALVRAAHSVYQPHRIILGTAGPVDPFVKTFPTGNSSGDNNAAKPAPATAYICTGTFCRPPTSDPATVANHLRPVPEPAAGETRK
ncbi:MAG: thioredoxin domain-containing protein, partial [Verrucomicrobiaceae bacterium]